MGSFMSMEFGILSYSLLHSNTSHFLFNWSIWDFKCLSCCRYILAYVGGFMFEKMLLWMDFIYLFTACTLPPCQLNHVLTVFCARYVCFVLLKIIGAKWSKEIVCYVSSNGSTYILSLYWQSSNPTYRPTCLWITKVFFDFLASGLRETIHSLKGKQSSMMPLSDVVTIHQPKEEKLYRASRCR